MELSVAKCLNSPEYLSAIGTAVSKAIEKGMQDGLAAEITHGREGHALTDVAAYNPSAEADYALPCNNFRLMVPIHHSSDKTVVGASSFSLALDVSDAPLTGMEGTSDVMPATADITTALFVTLSFADIVTLFSVDDYEVMGTDDQSAVNENVVDEDANPFPNIDDAKLNISR
uniref:Uncharacterized protein n=1 Tax=Tanacetum cinerariifolium TaxID=118510 RepID=A0A6L2MBH0_TANCI|nr:hypothetical protein [Tanacetum cinerariifolium]